MKVLHSGFSMLNLVGLLWRFRRQFNFSRYHCHHSDLQLHGWFPKRWSGRTPCSACLPCRNQFGFQSKWREGGSVYLLACYRTHTKRPHINHPNQSIGNPCPGKKSQLHSVQLFQGCGQSSCLLNRSPQQSSWAEYELSDLSMVILLFYLYIYFTYIYIHQHKCHLWCASTEPDYGMRYQMETPSFR